MYLIVHLKKNKHVKAQILSLKKKVSQKRIAPKGKVSATVWQRISRLVDKVGKLDKKTKSFLNLNREITRRNMLLENEATEWRDMRNLSGNPKKM